MAVTPFYSHTRPVNGSTPKTAVDPVQSLLRMGLTTRASILARRGHWKKAESLLLPLVSSERASVESVCLLAKIYAQQGRFNEAKVLWCKAYELDTTHSISGEFLERCLEPEPPINRRLISYSFAFTLLLFLLFGGFYFSFSPIQEYSKRLFAISTVPVKTNQEAEADTEISESAKESAIPDTLKALVLDPALLPSNDVASASPTLHEVSNSQEGQSSSSDSSSTVLTATSSVEFSSPIHAANPTSEPTPHIDLLELAQSILNENEEWKELNLQIEQENGKFAIRGEVPSGMERDEIEKALRSIPGVSEVNRTEMKLMEEYVVRPGDKLMDIAVRFYGSKSFYRKIAEANHLTSPNDIKYGQKLYLPRD